MALASVTSDFQWWRIKIKIYFARGEEEKTEENIGKKEERRNKCQREGLIIWACSGSVKKGLNKCIQYAYPKIWPNSRQITEKIATKEQK